MSILSKQSAEELRWIIKDATGRNISLGESYAIWHYLIKLLQILWNIEKRQKPLPPSDQLNLFTKPKKKRR